MNIDTSTLNVKIARKWVEATNVCGLELVRGDGGSLPVFSPGSHVDLHLPGGLVRQYSLCNDSDERHRYVIGVLKEPRSRGGSKIVHEILAEGDTLEISAPRNRFALANAKHYLLFAGGIGITPIICMAERLARSGASFDLHYSARTPDRIAFASRIEGACYRENVHLHLDDGPAEQKLDLITLLATPLPGTHLYVCGPRGYMDWIIEAARTNGWPSTRIHYEYFTPVEKSDLGDEFELQIASSSEVLKVPPGVTAASVLIEHGVDLPLSCEAGVCGTCLMRVLSGTPLHRDVYLTAEEKARNNQFTPCCSRARGRLVVDL